MEIIMKPIGYVKCDIKERHQAPRHCSISDREGVIEILPQYEEGLYRIGERSRIVVIFNFHKSKGSPLQQYPSGGKRRKGVFSICSPDRPNSIGMSVLELLRVEGNKLYVKNIDMIDGTPVLDIKPYKPPNVDNK
ncbi:MAG: tRNA (N6-threonylcarbamoyladenosine(37)-N6)-methyltransferase TrmO [Candidatus Eremiobacteraeota bacterium]|nr:tRNA (N6-threonylcarbamoyladenosine(37)-N6)-methyltransferase TrmO [Candidatus Eremiobacteraeota bacterium]